MPLAAKIPSTNVITVENNLNYFQPVITFVFRDFLQFPTVSLCFEVLLDNFSRFMTFIRYNTPPNFVNIFGIPTTYAAN